MWEGRWCFHLYLFLTMQISLSSFDWQGIAILFPQIMSVYRLWLLVSVFTMAYHSFNLIFAPCSVEERGKAAGSDS